MENYFSLENGGKQNSGTWEKRVDVYFSSITCKNLMKTTPVLYTKRHAVAASLGYSLLIPAEFPAKHKVEIKSLFQTFTQIGDRQKAS